MEVQNNNVKLVGKISSGFTFSHSAFGEGFYTTYLEVGRTSGAIDVIPLIISERLINVNEDCCGSTVAVIGQFRSYNRHEGTKNRLVLSVFVQEINFMEESTDCTNNNQIFLDGYICKIPTYRKTPLGRDISDIMLAVNRRYGRTDYIPLITWGRDAEYSTSLGIGTRIAVSGRIQSREYQKRLSDTEFETRVAYEVCVNCLDDSVDMEDMESERN